MTIHAYWNVNYLTKRWTQRSGGGQLCANSEIAWHLASGLRERFPSDAICGHNMGDPLHDEAPSDLHIGHIGPWANAALAAGRRVVPMAPWPSALRWPYDTIVYNAPHRAILDAVPRFIALTGPWAWEQSAGDAILSRWRHKARPVALGFSRDLFPRTKRTFNPPGRRGFLYVGQVAEQKGVAVLLQALKPLGALFVIRNGEWTNSPEPSFARVDGWIDNAAPEVWEQVAAECDFSLHAPLWDCQPVAPLECASRGFVPLHTPSVSFGPGTELTGAVAHDTEVLRWWIEAPDEELRSASDRAIAALDSMPWSAFQDAVAAVVLEALA